MYIIKVYSIMGVCTFMLHVVLFGFLHTILTPRKTFKFYLYTFAITFHYDMLKYFRYPCIHQESQLFSEYNSALVVLFLLRDKWCDESVFKASSCIVYDAELNSHER